MAQEKVDFTMSKITLNVLLGVLLASILLAILFTVLADEPAAAPVDQPGIELDIDTPKAKPAKPKTRK